jgi:hypothetical protein
MYNSRNHVSLKKVCYKLYFPSIVRNHDGNKTKIIAFKNQNQRVIQKLTAKG